MKKFFLIFLVVFLSFLSTRQLFLPGYFPMQDDLQVSRLYEMDLCIKDGQLPCRWVPDMGYGYGYPLFNYYPPLPYYVGEAFHLLGFSFINSVKILFILGMMLSGIFMYYLAKEFWGEWGGLVSAVFYIWAPYHAVDLYVRGAMNEFWALAFFPAILWSVLKVFEKGKKYVVVLALSFSGLLLSHNIMSMLFAPIIGLWTVGLPFLFKKDFSWKLNKKEIMSLVWVFLGGVWGIALAAFFILPALLEKSQVHIETMFMGYFNYLAHFVSLNQLFISRFWGFGASVWGPGDGMSFPLGHLHWVMAVVVFLGFFVQSFKKKQRELVFVSFFFFLFLLSAFLTHPRSSFIWQKVFVLEYLQFPWRFLAISIFSLSFLAGGVVFLYEKQRRVFVSLLLIFAVVGLNFNYFKPERVVKITDKEKIFSQKGWHKLQTDAIFDYLPIVSTLPPTSPAPAAVMIKSGDSEIKAKTSDFKKGTNWISFNVDLKKKANLIAPSFYFSGWKGWVDEKKAPLNHESDLGRITLNVDGGKHQVYLRLGNSSWRSWSNFISMLAWWGALIVVLQPKLWPWIPKK